jgi:hypothetical protein
LHAEGRINLLPWEQWQQFKPMDASTPLSGQKQAFELIRSLTERDCPFKDKEKGRKFFTQVTGLAETLI